MEGLAEQQNFKLLQLLVLKAYSKFEVGLSLKLTPEIHTDWI